MGKGGRVADHRGLSHSSREEQSGRREGSERIKTESNKRRERRKEKWVERLGEKEGRTEIN